MMIGFGISNSSDVKNAQRHSDGAIIGSAYLKAVNRGESIVFVEELYR